MTHTRQKQKKIAMGFAAGIFLFMVNAMAVWAVDLPAHIENQVLKAYPGATIRTVRYETYKGQMAYEVEIKTRDGQDLEVILSDEGRILDVEEENGLPWLGGELSLGAAVLAQTEIYRGTDSEIQPALFLSYENDRFELRAYDALEVVYTFFKNDGLSLGVKGALFFDEGYDADDSTFLRGMDKLDTLYSAGLESEWQAGGLTFEAEVLQDVSGEHDGRQLEIGVTKDFHAGGFEFTPGLSLTWMSQDMVDYFYGVSSREARTDRKQYAPKSDYEIELELMVQRPLFGRFTAVGIAGISTFGSEIKDSPIVDQDYTAQLVLGIMYSF